jgi:hypothetical protein
MGYLTYPTGVTDVGLTGETRYSQEPTLEVWRHNIMEAGLEDYVMEEVVESTNFYPPFKLDFLLIDALHDEINVRYDWSHYRPRIKIDSIVAWHDYGAWAGVTNTVDDLLQRGIIEKEFQGGSLILTKYKGEI